MTTIVACAIGLCLLMTLAWAVGRQPGRSGWIDAIWTAGVGLFGAVAALVPSDAAGSSHRQWLVMVMVALWAGRLAFHIARRTIGGGDDPRYRQLRDEWGDAFGWRLLGLLQVQAVAAVVLVVAVAVAAHRPGPLDLMDGIGVALLVVAILGENAADRQLARFRSDPANRGRVCDVGLWARSRHPNYVFEWLAWIAYVPVAVALGGGYPAGLLALAAPAMMYALLVHVSGIPPLEAHMLRSRGDAFRDYQRRVNAFWPALGASAGRERSP